MTTTARLAEALYRCARPALFRMDPERAHRTTLAALDLAHRLGLSRLLAPTVPDDPVDCMGLRFANPVGLAAGLDKDAAHLAALGGLGFGFIEAGTVTPRPQPGNPKPRLFRLVEAGALINRFGFNNAGLEAFLDNVRRGGYRGILGLNIGKNAATPIERALDDYVAGLRGVYALASYVTINISSPNTRDLRSLQRGDEIDALLAGVMDERNRLADRHGRRVPIAVKIAPDLDDDDLRRLADVAVRRGADALIATNTTTDRSRVAQWPLSGEAGGLSGQPLRERSTAVIATLGAHLGGRLPIIGVGGIHRGADALEKIRAGATLVQLYTGLVYRGPALVAECRDAIREARPTRGASTTTA